MYEGVKVCRNNIANFRKEIEAINVPKDAPACSCGEQPAPEQKNTECASNFGKETAACGCSEAENGEKPASAEQPSCCNVALKAENDYKKACEAWECESAGNQKQAIQKWGEVFGSSFPGLG